MLEPDVREFFPTNFSSVKVYVRDSVEMWRVGSLSDLERGDGEHQNDLIWIDLDFEQEGAFEWLSETMGIEPLTCEALFHKGSRPRVAEMNDGLLVIRRTGPWVGVVIQADKVVMSISSAGISIDISHSIKG